jgi:hypothetical protein
MSEKISLKALADAVILRDTTRNSLRDSQVLSVPKVAREMGRPWDTAATALALLCRLRCFTLPSGRIPAINVLAHRVRRLSDPAAILCALQSLEEELVAIGGQYDPALSDAALAIATVFPSARLIAVGKKVLS